MLKNINRLTAILVLSLTLFLSACSLPGLSGAPKNTVRIGTVLTTETQILGQMIKQLIEHETDLEVTMVSNLGSSIVAHQAMLDNQVDISAARYTGTDLAGALEMDPVKDPDAALNIVQKEFEKRWDQKWYDSYGFDNTYAFTVTKELAEEKGIEKVSDLASLSGDLRFGVDNSWIHREGDGYQGFVETYGFQFPQIYPMQIGLVYQALDHDEMDVVLAYSSDGRIAAFDLKILEDDKKFFPPYDASAVASNDILRKHPELDKILEKLVGKIDTETMQRLNYEADGRMREPAIVAQEFLEQHNYFEEVE